MKTYTVLYAEEVPHYGIDTIEATDDTAAIVLAKAQPLTGITLDPDYENAICKRIVHIEDAAGNIIATDIALDNCFIRYGGEPERKLCDLASHYLEALQRIAAIPLWGEAITDPERKADLIEYGEYDVEADAYNPTIDTESSTLTDVIEIARDALAKAIREAKGGVA